MRLALLLLFTIPSLFLSAQTNIQYGDNILGNIASVGEENHYTFNGKFGDRIYIRMRDAETPIDACFSLLAPDGSLIENPCGNGGIVTIKDFTINEEGTYSIITKDAGDNDTGDYGLSLTKLNSPAYAQAIPCDFDATENLTTPVEVKAFSFTANESDRILIRMRGEGTHIESEIELYNSAGDLITSDAGSGLSFIGPFSIPTTDTYTLLAMDKNGNDLGNVGISFQVLNKNECANVLKCGDNIYGSIDHLAQITSYLVKANDGERLLFNARSENSSVENHLFIYDGDGNEITSTPGEGKQAEIITDELEEGYYQIVYLDKGGNDTGNYGLSLQTIKGNDCATALSCENDQVIANLPYRSTMQSFSFYAEKDATVGLSAIALNPSIDPLLLVYNEAGEMIATAESFQNTIIDNLEIASTGRYLVILKDKSGNDTGDIEISIDLEAFMPVPMVTNLPVLEIECGGLIENPNAQIPCGEMIEGVLSSTNNFMNYGEHEVNWLYTDDNGNTTTQVQTIVVVDNTPPSILCEEVLSLTLNENGEAFLDQSILDGIVFDDCSGIAWVESSIISFNCDNIGTQTIQIFTEDNFGNETGCELVIVVNDANGNCNNCEEIPNPWKQADIGSPQLEGSACYYNDGPRFEVSGNGTDIFGYNDQFTFVYQEICGNKSMIAKVKNISADGDFAFGGVMIRQSLDSDSKYAAMLATNTKGVLYQARTETGHGTLYEAHEGHPEIWIKITKQGNFLSGYISTDGIDWELNCELKIKLGGCYYAGLVVNSNSSNTLNVVNFEEVSLEWNGGSRQAEYSSNAPTTLAMADPCLFEIAERGDTPDCVKNDKGSKKEKVVKNFNSFPNPAREVVNVDLEEFIGENIRVRLISRRGRVVFEQDFENTPYGISIPLATLRLTSGIYNLQIISDDGITSKPLSIIDEY